MRANAFKYTFIFLVYPLILSLIFPITFTNSNTVDIRSEMRNHSSDIKIPEYHNYLETIVIDPGHGGYDKGTSENGLLEKDVVLAIAKKLKLELEQLGYNILMTREDDTPNYKPSNIIGSEERKDLDGRLNYAKENNAKFFVSIHVDNLKDDRSRKGSVVYYYSKSEESKAYAIRVQKALNEILVNNKPRIKSYIQTDNFFVLKYSDIPSILVETGYITNSQDFELLSEDSFREEVAKAIARGIDDSLK